VKIVEQLCIKSFTVTAQDGGYWKAEQGKVYTTSVPCSEKDTVIVFSQYWVPAPKDHFVL
jgi:hypothetical protein